MQLQVFSVTPQTPTLHLQELSSPSKLIASASKGGPELLGKPFQNPTSLTVYNNDRSVVRTTRTKAHRAATHTGDPEGQT